jgi:hypothetical protein
MRQLTSILLYCLCMASSAIAQSSPDPLTQFLRNYLGKPYPPSEQQWPTRYSSALVDLKDDGTKEVIVYITGGGWCGTGGCVTLILAPEGTTYRVVTKATVTRLPIRVLPTKSNGWHDVSVVARTSGTEPLYEAILPFDGKTYPNNPTVPPAHRLDGEDRGRIVIPVTTKEKPVYE